MAFANNINICAAQAQHSQSTIRSNAAQTIKTHSLSFFVVFSMSRSFFFFFLLMGAHTILHITFHCVFLYHAVARVHNCIREYKQIAICKRFYREQLRLRHKHTHTYIHTFAEGHNGGFEYERVDSHACSMCFTSI